MNRTEENLRRILAFNARVLDTKGYPDDKNPAHWRKINGAPVHMDNNGNYDGGAGGKFNGNHHYGGPDWKQKAANMKSLANALAAGVSQKQQEAPKPAIPAVEPMKEPETPKKPEKKFDPDSAIKELASIDTWNNKDEYKEKFSEFIDDLPVGGMLADYSGWNCGLFTKQDDGTFQLETKFTTKHDVPKEAVMQTFPYNHGWAGGYFKFFLPGHKFSNQEQIDAAWKSAEKIKKSIATQKTAEKKKQKQAELKKAFEDYKTLVKEKSPVADEPATDKKLENMETAISTNWDNWTPPPKKPKKPKYVAKALSPTTFGAPKGLVGFSNTPIIKSPIDSYDEYVGISSDVWQNGTPEEKAAVYEYTYAYHQFNEPLRGIEYGTNAKLGLANIDWDMIGVNHTAGGSQKKKRKGAVKAMINHVTELIDKSSYPFDLQLVRGTGYNGLAGVFGLSAKDLTSAVNSGDVKTLKKLLVGKEGLETAFSSCGSAKGTGFTSEPVSMHILSPAGTKQLYVAPFSFYGPNKGAPSPNGYIWDGNTKSKHPLHENEMILQRGTKFLAHKVEIRDNDGSPQLHIWMEIIGQNPAPLETLK